jgi:hypothetical protein
MFNFEYQGEFWKKYDALSNYAKVHQCYPNQDVQCRVVHPITSQDKIIFQNAELLLDMR